MALELIPDHPVAFGYKQIWLAVRGSAPRPVALALGLKDLEDSTWKDGIKLAYEQGYDRARQQYGQWQGIFVSPSVLGWTLAVGGIGALPTPGIPEWLSWLRDLGAKLGPVQSFGTHRVSSAVFWAKAEHGRIVRAYGYEDGTTSENEGDPTPEEVALGFDFLDERRATPAEVSEYEARVDAEFARFKALMIKDKASRAEAETRGKRLDEDGMDEDRFASRYDLLVPGEDSVMMLAGRWSLDPTKLEEYGIEPGLGLIGMVKRR